MPSYVAELRARPGSDESAPATNSYRSSRRAAIRCTAPMKVPGPPLLKADTSDGGEGWSDSQIAAALETSVDTVARTRQRLVEEGFQAALIRKHPPNSARRRIFDGAAAARLIALACSKPPIGRARWTLQLLEEEGVGMKIDQRARGETNEGAAAK